MYRLPASALLLTLATTAAADEQPPLIDIETFFQDPQYRAAQLSPDGESVAFQSPHEELRDYGDSYRNSEASTLGARSRDGRSIATPAVTVPGSPAFRSDVCARGAKSRVQCERVDVVQGDFLANMDGCPEG